MNDYTNLLRQLVNYGGEDIPITGNPQVTFFAQNIGPKFYRYTHFTYGMISLTPTIINETKCTSVYPTFKNEIFFDTLNEFVIIIDKFSDLKKIDLFIGELDKITIIPEYLEIYNIVCKKIIFETDLFCTIIINPINFLYSSNYNSSIYTVLPMLVIKKFSIDIYSLNSEKIQLKIKCCLLDSEERKKIGIVNNIYDPNIISIEHSKNDDVYNLIQNNFFIKTNTIVIRIKDLNLLESVEILIDDNKIELSKNIIKIYDFLYNQIIFRYNDEYLVKLNYYIFSDTEPDKFSIKINYKKTEIKNNENNNCEFCPICFESKYNLVLLKHAFPSGDVSSHKMCVNCMNKLTKNICPFCKENIFNEGDGNVYSCFQYENKDKYILYMNNDFISYYKEYVYELNKPILIEELYSFHIKEIIIFFTDNINKEKITKKIANKILIKIEDVVYEYTSIDCDIYQQTHHDNFDPYLYTIGYSLKPTDTFPTGLLNTKKRSIEIHFNLIENINKNDISINILIFGYYVYKKIPY